MKSQAVHARTILTESSISEIDLYLNPYIGCTHSCVYCCVEYMKSFSGHGSDRWGEFVDYKANAVELLAREIDKARGKNVMVGSLTDAYQPIEKQCELTRQCLGLLAAHRVATFILTKSDLVLRDTELLAGAPASRVGMTLAFADDRCRQAFEPRTCATSRRIAALTELHDAGCTTFAFVGPIIPDLSDLDGIFAMLAPARVTFAMGKMIDVSRPFSHDVVRKIEDVAGADRATEVLRLARDPRHIRATEGHFARLCREHNIENHGFINPYAHALS